MAAFVAHQEPPEVSQPSEGPLHLPTLRVVGSDFYRSPSLGTLPRTTLVCRNGRFDSLRTQPLPEVLAVVSLVGDQLFWTLLRPAPSSSRHAHRLEGKNRTRGARLPNGIQCAAHTGCR